MEGAWRKRLSEASRVCGVYTADFVVSVQSVKFFSRKWGIIKFFKQKNDIQNVILIISYDINIRETGE